MATEWEEVELEDGTVAKIPKGLTDEQAAVYLKSNKALAQPEPSAIKTPTMADAVRGVGDVLLPEIPTSMGQGVEQFLTQLGKNAMGPAGQVAGAVPQMMEMFQKMRATPPSPGKVDLNDAQAIGYGMAGMIPGIGPMAAQAGETIGGGDVARGGGQAAAMIIPLLLSGALGKGAAPKESFVKPSPSVPSSKAAQELRNKLTGSETKLVDTKRMVQGIAELIGSRSTMAGGGRLAAIRDIFSSILPKSEPIKTNPKVPANVPRQDPVSYAKPGKVEVTGTVLTPTKTAAPTPYRAKEGIVRNVSTPAPEPTSAAKSGPVKGGKVLAKIEKKETALAKKAAARYKEMQAKKPKVKLPQPKIEKKETSSLAAPGWERIIRNAKGQFMRVEENA